MNTTTQFETTTVQPSELEPTQSSVRMDRMDWIARKLRRLEPVVGLSIGALTAWLAATSHSSLPVLWVFALIGIGVGGSAWLRRPAQQIEMAARALALLGAAYALHTVGGAPGAAAGVFFFWLGITAVYYAFVLKPLWGSVVAVASVLEFTAASLWAGGETLSSLSSGGAFLMILPLLLTMKLGAIARRPGEQVGKERIDSSTLLYNRGGFLAHGKLLQQRCRLERLELTLAVFDCNDLQEAREIYGSRTSRKLIDCIIQKLTLVAGERGLAARTGPTQFAVALPMSRERALQMIERVMGNPSRFELEGGNSEIVLVPNLMVETVSPAGTVERLYLALCRGLTRLQEEERRRHRYLQRQRERHSRPMAIQEQAPAAPPARVPRLDPDPVHALEIPATIPMPLASR